MNWYEKKVIALNALCEKYPDNIPVEEAARYMGIDPNVLREWALEHPDNPFVIGRRGNKYGYTRIITLAWYNWLIKDGAKCLQGFGFGLGDG